MQKLHSRTIESIDADALVECTGHEILFRGAVGFYLYLIDSPAGAAHERVTFLEAREALLWLNDSEPSPCWAAGFAEVSGGSSGI